MKKLFLILSFVYQLGLMAQITDNYSNAALWSEFDDSRNRMAFNAGRLNWDLTWNDGGTQAQSNLRCVRSLNNLISTSTNYRAAITYRVTTTLNTHTTVLALTQNNSQSFITWTGPGSTWNCHQNSSITVAMSMSGITIQVKAANATPKGISCDSSYEQIFTFNNVLNTDRRLELTRNGNRYRFRILDVTTNAELFNQVFCSSVNPTNLNFVQHGNHPWSGVNGGVLEVDDLSIDNNITDLTVNSFPTVTINGPRGVCEKDKRPITLTAVSPSATFVWNNPPTNGANLIVSKPGTYTVKATVNNCVSTSTAIVADSCRSASISSSNVNNTEIWAYPNPAKDYTELSYTNAAIFKANRIILTSILGQNIGVYDAESSLGSHTMTISTADLPSGIYFYSLERDGYRVVTKKVQIVR